MVNKKKNNYFFLVKSNNRFLWYGMDFVILIVSVRGRQTERVGGRQTERGGKAHSLQNWNVQR